VSLSSGDEVPHIFTRKSRLRPGKFLMQKEFCNNICQFRTHAIAKKSRGNVAFHQQDMFPLSLESTREAHRPPS
jgi:hypothetical protein